MLLHFVDRDSELKALEKAYGSQNPEFFIIYGRRRVGKTELVKKFASEKDHFYFLAKEENIELEIERFREKFSEKFNVFIEKTNKLEEVFKQILEKTDLKKKFILIIDEFPYWISKHRPIVSEFQYLWDELLKKHNIFLILLGSSVSMMEHEVLAVKSPLYGRRTGQLKVEPLKIMHVSKILPNYSVEDLFKTYGAVGGIPLYLKEFDDKLSFIENIKNTFFSKSNILSEEAEILLREELREVSTYFNIMKSIMEGSTKMGEIASKAKVDITNINKYISVLINLGYVKKEYPTTGQTKTKNFLYVLNDNYFRFWLKYVYPYKEEIEENADAVLGILKNNYSEYMGFIFEDICRKIIRYLKFSGPKISEAKIGRWWFKGTEIDIVALNENTKEILFGECKWSEKINAEKIVRELAEKAKCVQWNMTDLLVIQPKRKEYYAVFAKSFSKRIKEFEGKKVFCFDLQDLQKFLKKS